MKAVGIITLAMVALTFGTVTAFNSRYQPINGVTSSFDDSSDGLKLVTVYVFSNETAMEMKSLKLTRNAVPSIVVLKNTKLQDVNPGDVLVVNLDDLQFGFNGKILSSLEEKFLHKKGVLIFYSEKGIKADKLHEILDNLSLTKSKYNINTDGKALYYVFSLQMVGENGQTPLYYSLYADSSTKVEASDIYNFIRSIVQIYESK